MKKGVYIAKKKDQTVYYKASITFRNKHISLGSYPTEDAAHHAYCISEALLYDTGITAESIIQSPKSGLPFPKQMILLNFRDNGIYIPNAIYLRNGYFSYYLSPTEELIFDIDDLFYYSNRKIMKRAGHLFVNDYGMQVTIQSRYGIKPYGVEGRDYVFINGNNHDFRYSNIEILCPYNGVILKQKNDTIQYVARLHINGNYIIGTYDTITEAAIAYNKAIDLAKSHGIHKNFTPNYIDELSPREYADAYTRIKISKKFMHYL